MKFRISRLTYYLQTGWALTKYFLKGPKIKFVFDRLEDLIEIKEIIIDREYHKLIGSISKKDRVIVDIGGGMGDFAILTAVEHPWTKIWSFEPDTKRFLLLKKNCENNSVKNVFALQEAATNLELVSRMIGSKIDVLKIDCEGCEFDIIRSATNKLLKGIRVIVMEYHSWAGDVNNLYNKLENAWIKCTLITRKGVPDLGLLLASR